MMLSKRTWSSIAVVAMGAILVAAAVPCSSFVATTTKKAMRTPRAHFESTQSGPTVCASRMTYGQTFYGRGRCRQHQHLLPLFASSSRRDEDSGYEMDDSNEYNDYNFNVEAARQQLEELVSDGGASKRRSKQNKPTDASQQQQAQAQGKEQEKTQKRPLWLPSFLSSFLPPELQQPNDSKLPPPKPAAAAPAESFAVSLPAAAASVPLTTMERQRRIQEIQILQKLSSGDEALEELWKFWFTERGPMASARLLKAEEAATQQDPPALDKAEAILKDLVADYPGWVEPVNRLATLYYLQRRYAESAALCEIVLAVKPWHFGALSGIVLVSAADGKPEAAREWAAKRLPAYIPSNRNRRRQEWVDHAIFEARASLNQAEAMLERSFFGEPDEHASKEQRRQRKHKQQNKPEANADDAAWQ